MTDPLDSYTEDPPSLLVVWIVLANLAAVLLVGLWLW
jgi:hypothetical protein